MSDIRFDRLARTNYYALPDSVRHQIEAAIPEGCMLTVLSSMWNGRDYHARLFYGTWLIAESPRCRFVDVACWMALDERVTHEREGFVVEPLENPGDLNREGDPAFNGAFNRW